MALPETNEQWRSFYADSMKILETDKTALQNKKLDPDERVKHIESLCTTLSDVLSQEHTQSAGEYIASQFLNNSWQYHSLTISAVVNTVDEFAKNHALTYPDLEGYAYLKGYRFNPVWGQEC